MLSIVTVSGIQGTEVRILGGTNASPGEFPWTAFSFGPDGSNEVILCGGSLIAPQYVLTAGHCCTDQAGGKTSVQVGQQYAIGGYILDDMLGGIPGSSHGGEFITIQSATPHPGFNINTLVNDVCVVKLDTPSSVTTFMTPNFDAQVPNPENPGEAVTVGWGLTSPNGEPSQILQKVTINVIAQSKCEGKLGITLANSMICAGDDNASGDHGTCQGDSGDSLFITINGVATEIGSTSYGLGSCLNEPGVFARTSKFKHFICSATDNTASGCPNSTTHPSSPSGGVGGGHHTSTTNGATSLISASWFAATIRYLYKLW